MDTWVDVPALTKVLLASLVLGAGIPALFALGVRALATGDGGTRPSPGRVAAGVVCFGVVVAAVVLGVWRLVAAD